MKLFSKMMITTVLLLSLGNFSVVVGAEELPDLDSSVDEKDVMVEGQPVVFDNANNIDDVVKKINSYYEKKEPNSLLIQPFAAPGTKWRDGSVVSDGETGHYVTSYFWVRGSNMVTYNVVGRAQRKAVIERYGSVNNTTSYRMKTIQHVVKTSYQTQGYITISAQAVAYGREY